MVLPHFPMVLPYFSPAKTQQLSAPAGGWLELLEPAALAVRSESTAAGANSSTGNLVVVGG